MPIVQLVGKKQLEHRVSGLQPVTEFDRQRVVVLLQALLPAEARLQSLGIKIAELVGPGGLEALLARLNPPPAAEDDAVFFYRRLSGNVIAQFEHDYTVNGVLNFWGSRFAMGQAAMTGWKQVEDEEGHAIPFDPDLIPHLPGTIVRDIGLKVSDLVAPSFLLPSSGSSTDTRVASAGSPVPTVDDN